MNIKSIEPTPSPNTMKINLTEELPAGKSNNYKKETAGSAPLQIQRILEIDGVKGVYHVADFLAVERNAKFDWKQILTKIRLIFGEKAEEYQSQSALLDHYGEVNVSIQVFRGIPMQIKLNDGQQEKRFGLPETFMSAIATAQKPDDNVVLMRKWKDYGYRYGDMDVIAEEIKDELSATFTSEKLQQLVKQAASANTIQKQPKQRYKLTPAALEDENWERRYQALDQMEDPTDEDIPLLEKALDDPKVSIRRLATVYLGMIESTKVLNGLYKSLHDRNPAVRRTAGDCLSDLGFPEAMQEMARALSDKSKLVRWRAAMFLYEVGDESVLEALKAAENDPEFEVDMQIKMAINRIEHGEEAKGSVWKQMTEARKNKEHG